MADLNRPNMFSCTLSVKQTLYRPGQALRFPAGSDTQISEQLAHEHGKVVSPTHRPSLPPGNIPGTHFCNRLSQPQGQGAAGRLMSMKNHSDTIGNSTGDLPACGAQCLNQLRHRVSLKTYCTRSIFCVWSDIRHPRRLSHVQLVGCTDVFSCNSEKLIAMAEPI